MFIEPPEAHISSVHSHEDLRRCIDSLDRFLHTSPDWDENDDLVAIRRILCTLTYLIGSGARRLSIDVESSGPVRSWFEYGGNPEYCNNHQAPLDLKQFRELVGTKLELQASDKETSNDTRAAAAPGDPAEPTAGGLRPIVRAHITGAETQGDDQAKGKRETRTITRDSGTSNIGAKRKRPSARAGPPGVYDPPCKRCGGKPDPCRYETRGYACLNCRAARKKCSIVNAEPSSDEEGTLSGSQVFRQVQATEQDSPNASHNTLSHGSNPSFGVHGPPKGMELARSVVTESATLERVKEGEQGGTVHQPLDQTPQKSLPNGIPDSLPEASSRTIMEQKKGTDSGYEQSEATQEVILDNLDGSAMQDASKATEGGGIVLIDTFSSTGPNLVADVEVADPVESDKVQRGQARATVSMSIEEPLGGNDEDMEDVRYGEASHVIDVESKTDAATRHLNPQAEALDYHTHQSQIETLRQQQEAMLQDIRMLKETHNQTVDHIVQWLRASEGGIPDAPNVRRVDTEAIRKTSQGGRDTQDEDKPEETRGEAGSSHRGRKPIEGDGLKGEGRGARSPRSDPAIPSLRELEAGVKALVESMDEMKMHQLQMNLCLEDMQSEVDRLRAESIFTRETLRAAVAEQLAVIQHGITSQFQHLRAVVTSSLPPPAVFAPLPNWGMPGIHGPQPQPLWPSPPNADAFRGGYDPSSFHRAQASRTSSTFRQTHSDLQQLEASSSAARREPQREANPNGEPVGDIGNSAHGRETGMNQRGLAAETRGVVQGGTAANQIRMPLARQEQNESRVKARNAAAHPLRLLTPLQKVHSHESTHQESGLDRASIIGSAAGTMHQTSPSQELFSEPSHSIMYGAWSQDNSPLTSISTPEEVAARIKTLTQVEPPQYGRR